jgi:hypothetical protein
VDGVVTEDSDAFLFGARTVYKNIFSDKKFVEVCIAIYGVFIYLSIYSMVYPPGVGWKMDHHHHLSSIISPL